MEHAQPAPSITIYKLTSGYLVYLDNGNTVACTNVTSLSRALRNYLDEPAPMRVRPPKRPPTTSQMAAVAEVAPTTPEKPRNIPEEHPQGKKISAPFQGNGEVNPIIVQENLHKLCLGYIEGKLSPDQFESALPVACPGITFREAKLTLASYTGIPEAPPHRAPPQRDEQDHYKMAPDIDVPWEAHDDVTVMDLIDSVPVVTTMPSVGIIENGVAERGVVTEEGEIKTELPAYAEEWMVQDL